MYFKIQRTHQYGDFSYLLQLGIRMHVLLGDGQLCVLQVDLVNRSEKT